MSERTTSIPASDLEVGDVLEDGHRVYEVTTSVYDRSRILIAAGRNGDVYAVTFAPTDLVRIAA